MEEINSFLCMPGLFYGIKCLNKKLHMYHEMVMEWLFLFCMWGLPIVVLGFCAEWSVLVPGHLSVPGLKASILQPRFWPLFKKEIELFSTFRRPAMEAQRLPQGPIGIRAQEVHRHGTPSQNPCLGFPGIASRWGNCPFHRCWNWGLRSFDGAPGQRSKSFR